MKTLSFASNLFLIFLLATLVGAERGHAAAGVTITDISGVSAYEIGDGTNSVAYAGVMGSVDNGACNGATSKTEICNNCVYLSDIACNQTRIHGALYLTVNFTVTAEITAATTLHVGYTLDGGSTPTPLIEGTESSGDYIYAGSQARNAVVKGSTGSIRIRWGIICNLNPDFATDGKCDDPVIDISTFRLYLGLESSGEQFPSSQRGILTIEFPIDPSLTADVMDCTGGSTDTGFCEFSVKPGDEKVKIDDIIPNYSCPGTYKSLRVFYSPDGFAQATYGSSLFADIPIDSSCSPENDGAITGLENYVPLYFRMSVVDKANNNYFLADPVTDIPVASCAGLSVPPTPGEDLACEYVATPGVVEGLLPEDLNCFIATAAYGTPFAHKIADLRKFRDSILKPFEWGRSVIQYYYQVGPKAASFIAGKESLRKIVRAALWPVWGFAWLSVHYGIFGACLLIITFVVMAIISLRQWRWGQF